MHSVRSVLAVAIAIGVSAQDSCGNPCGLTDTCADYREAFLCSDLAVIGCDCDGCCIEAVSPPLPPPQPPWPPPPLLPPPPLTPPTSPPLLVVPDSPTTVIVSDVSSAGFRVTVPLDAQSAGEVSYFRLQMVEQGSSEVLLTIKSELSEGSQVVVEDVRLSCGVAYSVLASACNAQDACSDDADPLALLPTLLLGRRRRLSRCLSRWSSTSHTAARMGELVREGERRVADAEGRAAHEGAQLEEALSLRLQEAAAAHETEAARLCVGGGGARDGARRGRVRAVFGSGGCYVLVF